MIRSRCLSWIAVLAGLGLGGLTLNAQTVQEAGNDFFRVLMNSSAPIGRFYVVTGAEHPLGAGVSVLNDALRSHLTVRSHTGGADYVPFTVAPTSVGTVVNSSPFGAVTALGDSGLRVTYSLPGPPTTPDRMTVIMDVNVNGNSLSNSVINVATRVLNDGATPLNVGVRYFWNLRFGADPGPTFRQLNPSGPALITEATFSPPNFVAYQLSDNDVNAQAPILPMLGTANGPEQLVPRPNPPALLQYANATAAHATAFTYTTDDDAIVATAGQGNNSAIMYTWGATDAAPLSVPVGQDIVISASLFTSLSTDTSTECAFEVPTEPGDHPFCITRDARFWFTQAFNEDATCATLLKALQFNGGGLNLGFVCLPTTFRNNDGVKDEYDALIEVLGLFARKPNRTGEDSGLQSAKLRASKLCRERKRLAQELVAANANVILLGTDPASCLIDGLPAASELVAQATEVMVGTDLNAIRAMTVTLRKFNSSGVTTDFVGGLVECAPTMKKRELKQVSRDPTEQLTCPGLNDFCETAETLGSFPHRQSVDLRRYSDNFQGSACDQGGAEAIWAIRPPVAAFGRSFLVQTSGSNFDTALSVWSGNCTDLTPVTCNADANSNALASVTFTTNGSNTFYIVAEGKNGAYGKLKLRITSF